MNKTLEKCQSIGAVCAIAALFCLFTPAKGAVAYLSKVGPPPLRFWVVTTNDFNYSQFKLESATAASNPTPASGTGTNQIAATATESHNQNMAPTSWFSTGNAELRELNQPGTGEGNMAGEEKQYRPRENFNFPSPTASDLLTVTPQMIAQYLKPDSHATNSFDHPGTVVFVPADTSFMPPTVNSRSESQANYHTP